MGSTSSGEGSWILGEGAIILAPRKSAKCTLGFVRSRLGLSRRLLESKRYWGYVLSTSVFRIVHLSCDPVRAKVGSPSCPPPKKSHLKSPTSKSQKSNVPKSHVCSDATDFGLSTL